MRVRWFIDLDGASGGVLLSPINEGFRVLVSFSTELTSMPRILAVTDNTCPRLLVGN